MCRRELVACVSVAVSLAIGAVTTGPVYARGYYNLPGTFLQCTGHGYGGGYHAPLVLGLTNPLCGCCPNERRLLHSPSPYCPCACYYQPGREFEGTSRMPGSVPAGAAPIPPQPVPAPATAPAPSNIPAPSAPPAPTTPPAPITAPVPPDADTTSVPPAPSDIPMPAAAAGEESSDASVPPSAALPLFDAPVQL
jgi:hypothetical protein